MKKVSLLVCLLLLWNGCASPATTASQKSRLDLPSSLNTTPGDTPKKEPKDPPKEQPKTLHIPLTLDQTRSIAKVIQVRNVKLWTESNAPLWPLSRVYPSEYFYNPPEEPNGRHLRPGPADETMLSFLKRALESWSLISGTAIVTSKHGSAIDQTYPAIVAAFPDMKITGGLKMWPYIDAPSPLYGVDKGEDWLSNLEVWTQFEVDARRIVKMTGVPSIVIMAESPMQGFYAGWRDEDGVKHRWTPDYTKFRKAMAPLRALSKDGIKITWYPFGPHVGPKMEEGIALVTAILKAVPNSWFTTVGDGFPINEFRPELQRRSAAMRLAVGDRLHHHIFVTGGHYIWSNGNTKVSYTPKTFQRWLRDRSYVDDVWVFPGYSKQFTGEKFYELLIPEDFRDDGGEIKPPKKGNGEIKPPKKDGSIPNSLGGS